MSDPFPYKSLEEALSATQFFVEADSFSQHALHYMYQENPPLGFKSAPWKQVCKGWWRQLPGSQTIVNVSFAFIFDQLVCFYSATSVHVNWDDVTAFFEPYWKLDKEDRKRQCDANNFHNCMIHCKKLSEKIKK